MESRGASNPNSTSGGPQSHNHRDFSINYEEIDEPSAEERRAVLREQNHENEHLHGEHGHGSAQHQRALHYGAVVRLQHLVSKKFVTLMPGACEGGTNRRLETIPG